MLKDMMGRESVQEMVHITATFYVFFVSLLFPYIETPLVRKLLSTSLGVFISFYYSGSQNFLQIIHFMVPFFLLKLLPARAGMISSITFAALMLFGEQIWEYSHGVNLGKVNI